MLKTLALAALGVALALPPEAVLAEQGASSSYGSVGSEACDSHTGAHAEGSGLEP